MNLKPKIWIGSSLKNNYRQLFELQYMCCTIIWTKILTRPYLGSKNHFWRINCSVNSFCSLSTFCNASCWTRNLKKMYQWEMLVTCRCHRLHHSSSSSLSLLLFSSSSQSWTKSIEKTPHKDKNTIDAICMLDN